MTIGTECGFAIAAGSAAMMVRPIARTDGDGNRPKVSDSAQVVGAEETTVANNIAVECPNPPFYSYKRDIIDSTRSAVVTHEERGDSVRRRGKSVRYKNTLCLYFLRSVCQTSPTVHVSCPVLLL